MNNPIAKNLIEIAYLVVIVAAVFIVCRIRKFPIKTTLGLIIPERRAFLYWIGLFIPIIIAGELFYYSMGLSAGRVWVYSGIETILRILKIAILGPIAEEIIFRGLMFDRIATSKPGPVWALVITSLLFACAHFSYQLGDMAFVLVDALYWGLVRYKTKSIVITIILHVIVNCIAVIEFLFINKPV
jgi:membrane protease YdiL (CAAX protease family)